MQRYKHIFMYGFAIFAMFFGSGNLVFPLQIGQNSGNQWMLGFLGLFLTGILLPFLGLFVINLYRGCYETFFAQAGPVARLVLPLFTLSLLGSFGVVPRCITVAYGGIGPLSPSISLEAFSLGFCIICYLICLKDQIMISVVGKWMTPILLTSLAILIVLGIIQAPPMENMTTQPEVAFSMGFLKGYHTMDLFASFFFSALIFRQIQDSIPNKEDHMVVLKSALQPSIMGACLLAAIYFGFSFLGAYYTDITSNSAPECILPAIATHIMGQKAALIIGIIMIFSCLTTGVALNNIYARYLCSLLKLSNSSFPFVLLCTTSISYLISLLDFQGIATFLTPVLQVSYPSLILLTFLSIFLKGFERLKMVSFYGVLAYMLYYLYI
ncbi:branched-chain amino acid transport system II carrier protein [Candidatus Paracaedibacter symbiosus]|uniref:branched-chain amino acid transport system II carrier protein n=1 Tax=Candidatus Paracaedibacter symbiosus TaxID=244582 RepID=UPI0006902CB0|nr:branched-chain amino acid transport system II carrier protein [Candidatus Paracaedibacter symbiosus]